MIELTGALNEIKLSKIIPPMIQYQMLFLKPTINEHKMIKAKIKFGLKKTGKYGMTNIVKTSVKIKKTMMDHDVLDIKTI